MTSDKQRKANRESTKTSTGPRNDERKSRSSPKALEHRALARDAVIPSEEPADFDRQFRNLEDTIEANPQVDAATSSEQATKSRLEKILETLKSDAFSTTAGSLIEIWRDGGKSEEEIKELLAQFQEREKKRVERLEALRDEAKRIEACLEDKQELLERSELIVAKLDNEIAGLKGRIAERQLMIADLKKRAEDREKEAEALQDDINKLKTELGLS